MTKKQPAAVTAPNATPQYPDGSGPVEWPQDATTESLVADVATALKNSKSPISGPMAFDELLRRSAPASERDFKRLLAEVSALKAELARMEDRQQELVSQRDQAEDSLVNVASHRDDMQRALADAKAVMLRACRLLEQDSTALAIRVDTSDWERKHARALGGIL